MATPVEQLAETIRLALIENGFTDDHDDIPYRNEMGWLVSVLKTSGEYLITDGNVYEVKETDWKGPREMACVHRSREKQGDVVNIDPNQVFHQSAIEMVREDERRQRRWLDQMRKEQAEGHNWSTEIAELELIVKSLAEMANYAAERRMLATLRWIYNGAAAARVADKEAHPWAGLPEEDAVAVRAAVRAGKVLRMEHVKPRFGVATDLKLIEFTDPQLGQRWAVSVTMIGERYLTDHPTKFDADTRYLEVLRAAGGEE